MMMFMMAEVSCHVVYIILQTESQMYNVSINAT